MQASQARKFAGFCKKRRIFHFLTLSEPEKLPGGLVSRGKK